MATNVDELSIYLKADTSSAEESLKGLSGVLSKLSGSSVFAKDSLVSMARAERESGDEAEKSGKKHDLFAKTLKTLGSAFRSVGGSVRKKFSPDLQHGFTTVLKYAFGIRSLFVALKKLRSAIKDGFGNLRQYSGEVDSSLTTMTNSLTQVKNALAVAFAPIVTAIVPYVRALANAITVLLNKLAQLLGALTGRSFVVQADSSFGDIASGVDAVGGSAGSSKKKIDELKKALMGFDEINKLPDSSDSGSGGGGGGGGGATDIGKMFETVEVDSVFKDFAKLLKDSWANADFTEVGKLIGDKLNGALQNIDWTNIKKNAEKVGKSLATLINGFVSSEVNGQSIGTTIGITLGEAVNTGISYFHSISSNLDFRGIGRTIADGINGFFKTVDAGGLGKTLSNFVIGGLNTLSTTLQNIDPNIVVGAITDFVNNIDWGEIITSIIEAIGSAISLSVRVLWEIGKNIVLGIVNGFSFKNFSKTVKGFFKNVVKAIKNAFGIKSPAKAPEIRSIGKNIVLGILEGFSGGFSSIGKWAGKLKEKIAEGFKKAKDKALDIKDLLGEKFEGVEDWVSSTKESFSEKWSETKTDLGDGFNATVDFVKGKIDEGISWLFGGDDNRVSRTLDVKVPSGTDTKIKNVKKAWTDFRTATSPSKKKNTRTLNSSFSYKENGKKSSGSGGILSSVRSWWKKHTDSPSSKTIKSSFTSKGTSSLEKVKKAWESVKSATKSLKLSVTGTGSTVIAKAKKAWDGLKSKALSISAKAKLPKISWSTKTFTKGPFSIDYPWPKISWYAKGGFPEDGWFRASRGEIMGKFDNGQSVVANNMQITEGISRAVERGMARAFMLANTSGQGNTSQQPIIVKVGEKTVYNGFVDYVRKTTYATGTNPILI